MWDRISKIESLEDLKKFILNYNHSIERIITWTNPSFRQHELNGKVWDIPIFTYYGKGSPDHGSGFLSLQEYINQWPGFDIHQIISDMQSKPQPIPA